MFLNIGVLKNFVIFTENIFVIKNFLVKMSFLTNTPKKLHHRCFLVNITKFLKHTFYGTSPVAASAFLKVAFSGKYRIPYISRKISVAEA